MRNFSKIISVGIVATAALAFAPVKLEAQQVIRTEGILLKDKIAGSTTVSYSTNGNVTVPQRWIFPIVPNQPITLEGWVKGTNAGTEAITFVCAPSNTGTNFDLTHKWTWSVNLVSATAPGTILTNADLSLWGAAKYFCVVSAQNAHASYVDVKLDITQATNPR